MNGQMKITTLVALALALALAPGALGAQGFYGHARPDDRAGVRGPAVTGIQAVRPDDRAGTRGPATYASPAPTIVRVTASDFDWSSAGIGAAAGAGAIAALLGAFLLVRSSRVEPQAA